jgi:HEAT repeat protein
MVLLAGVMLSTLVKAQHVTTPVSENAINNLIIGIKSDNEGLNRSCIYYAGKYRIREAVDALIDKMSNVKDANTKVLIALSLYEIRDAKGLEAVRRQSLTDENERVKKMSALIFSEYVKNSNLGYVSIKSKF